MNGAHVEDTGQRGPVSSLVIAVLGLAAILGAYMLPATVLQTPPPQPWGVPLALVALIATLVGLILEELIFSEKKGTHKFALEIGMVAIFALISLGIIQYYDSATDHFPISIIILQSIKISTSSATKATFLLVIFAAIPLMISLALAYLQHQRRSWFLRLMSLVFGLASYVLFMITLLYAK